VTSASFASSRLLKARLLVEAAEWPGNHATHSIDV
jgi:hypothetical protein